MGIVGGRGGILTGLSVEGVAAVGGPCCVEGGALLDVGGWEEGLEEGDLAVDVAGIEVLEVYP